MTIGRVYVKNPTPVFRVPEGKGTQAFNEKLKEKARKGFTGTMLFKFTFALARQAGTLLRMRSLYRTRRDAIDQAAIGLCHHYDTLTKRVNVSMTTLAIECGLATESATGKISITRLTRALQTLNEMKLITYNTEFDSTHGAYFPTEVVLLPAFFEVLEVSEESVEAARVSKAAQLNKKRQAKGLNTLSVRELVLAEVKRYRDMVYQKRAARKERGEERARAKAEAALTRAEIEGKVRKELNCEILRSRISFKSLSEVAAEIERRVKRRMILSRGNYSRLNPA